jgi:hypothetical protein
MKLNFIGMRRAALVAGSVVILGLAAGCGGSGSQGPSITVGAARSYEVAGFAPSQSVRPGVPVTVTFKILQPSGEPLTEYRRGTGPHTGIHLIVVRRDLSVLIHRHPRIQADGTVRQQLVFPSSGPYKVVIDAYPKQAGPSPSFQLFKTIRVQGKYRPQPLPAYFGSDSARGYTFSLNRAPGVRALQATLLNFTVTGPDGKPAKFRPLYGALAHAIFFRAGTLDYFHTHVCAPGASGCSSALGGAKVTGVSATPGKLDVGVLLPIGGTWRLFLQCRVGGQVITAPFTLRVR